MSRSRRSGWAQITLLKLRDYSRVVCGVHCGGFASTVKRNWIRRADRPIRKSHHFPFGMRRRTSSKKFKRKVT